MMHVSFMGLAVVLNDVWYLRHILPIVVSTFTQIKCNPSQLYYDLTIYRIGTVIYTG